MASTGNKVMDNFSTIFWVWITNVIPVTAFCLLFTFLGFGDIVYRWTSDYQSLAYEILIGTICLAMVLYLFDFFSLDAKSNATIEGKHENASVSLVVVLLRILIMGGVSGGVILAHSSYPAAPLLFFLVATPGFMHLIRRVTPLKQVPIDEYLKFVGYSLVVTASVMMTTWALWIGLESKFWLGANRDSFKRDMECPGWPSNSTQPFHGTSEEYDCLVAFLAWLSPLVASLACLFFAWVATLLSVLLNLQDLKEREKEATTDQTRAEQDELSEIRTLEIGNSTPSHTPPLASQESEAKKQRRLEARKRLSMVAFPVVLLLLGSWIFSYLSGANMRMANVVIQGFLVCQVVASFVVIHSVSWKKVEAYIKEATKNIRTKDENRYIVDWGHALFLFILFIPFLGFVALSSANQIVRRIKSGFQPIDPATHHYAWVTQKVSKILAEMKDWKWTSVLTKVLWLGVLYFGLVVGAAKVTTLVLSWLNDTLAGLPLGAVIGIFVLVGLVMFLLPPVPGVPVYFTGGVIVTQAAWSPLGFWGALALACGVCFGIKLIAIAMQQKLIGEKLGSHRAIRNAVGINSVAIRTVRHILDPRPPQDGGPTVDNEKADAFKQYLLKVSILVGGPDWPTSVLTGILKLNVWEMLAGSLPVVFLIAPTTAAGAFQLRVSEGGSWEGIASLTLALAAFVQGGAATAATYFINDASKIFKQECNRHIYVDEEVRQVDLAEESKRREFLRLTDWHGELADTDQVSHSVVRASLVIACLLMGAACHLVQLVPESCFESFEVTDSISCPSQEVDQSEFSSKCLNGNALNFVKFTGWVAIGMFATASLCLWAFYKWAAREIAKISPDKMPDTRRPNVVKVEENSKEVI